MLYTDFKILGKRLIIKIKYQFIKKTNNFLKGYWIGDCVAGILLLTLQTVFILRIDWKKSAQKVIYFSIL
jgi:hypothetical protein